MKSVIGPRVALRCRWEGYSKGWSLTRMIMDVTEESTGAAYDRGVLAGEIAARLANHDLHFKQINGHVSDLTGEIRGMRMDIQRLADQAEASAKTVLATAEALRGAEESRAGEATRNWSPWIRAFSVLSALATALSIITMIIVLNS